MATQVWPEDLLSMFLRTSEKIDEQDKKTASLNSQARNSFDNPIAQFPDSASVIKGRSTIQTPTDILQETGLRTTRIEHCRTLLQDAVALISTRIKEIGPDHVPVGSGFGAQETFISQARTAVKWNNHRLPLLCAIESAARTPVGQVHKSQICDLVRKHRDIVSAICSYTAKLVEWYTTQSEKTQDFILEHAPPELALSSLLVPTVRKQEEEERLEKEQVVLRQLVQGMTLQQLAVEPMMRKKLDHVVRSPEKILEEVLRDLGLKDEDVYAGKVGKRVYF